MIHFSFHVRKAKSALIMGPGNIVLVNILYFSTNKNVLNLGQIIPK